MKIIRYFIQTLDEETGIRGFQPLWVPRASNFSPTSLLGMVHDMLEHSLSDRGHYHEELQASGRMVALRGVPGVESGNYFRTFEESLGDSMGSAWADVLNLGEADRLHPAPETAPVDDHVEQMFRVVVKSAIKAAVSEMQEYSDDETQGYRIEPNFAGNMLGWLRIGYRDALRRYGGQDEGCWNLGHYAFRWVKEFRGRVDRAGEDEELDGSVMRLCLDTENLRMEHRLIEGRSEDGEFPAWLRKRIWHWRNDSIPNLPFVAQAQTDQVDWISQTDRRYSYSSTYLEISHET